MPTVYMEVVQTIILQHVVVIVLLLGLVQDVKPVVELVLMVL